MLDNREADKKQKKKTFKLLQEYSQNISYHILTIILLCLTVKPVRLVKRYRFGKKKYSKYFFYIYISDICNVATNILETFQTEFKRDFSANITVYVTFLITITIPLSLILMRKPCLSKGSTNYFMLHINVNISLLHYFECIYRF